MVSEYGPLAPVIRAGAAPTTITMRLPLLMGWYVPAAELNLHAK